MIMGIINPREANFAVICWPPGWVILAADVTQAHRWRGDDGTAGGRRER